MSIDLAAAFEGALELAKTNRPSTHLISLTYFIQAAYRKVSDMILAAFYSTHIVQDVYLNRTWPKDLPNIIRYHQIAKPLHPVRLIRVGRLGSTDDRPDEILQRDAPEVLAG
jgi:hypothetical protein